MLTETQTEILRFVQENDVKFIRLAFCDLFGAPKNIAILSSQLKQAFEHGILFDASSIAGFQPVECSDLFLVPDCSSISILPWRPSHERVMRMVCSVKNPDGSDYAGDTRNLLKQAVERAAGMGLLCRIGTECEFYLFQAEENGLPSTRPMDNGGYADIAPLDKGENIRRNICLALEQMGLLPERSYHEHGPGQNEVDFRYSEPLTAADNFLVFKTAVKAIASASGLYASFLPKPLANNSGNGLHVNLSLSKFGKNMFRTGPEHCESAESFIAGILEHAAELSVFLNPLTNSYRRLGGFEAPRYVTWSHQNRSQLIRIPASFGEDNRMELRSPDPSCNPYLAFALLLHAGLDGIERHTKLVAPCNRNLQEESLPEAGSGIARLPENLQEALRLADQSELIHRILPDEMWNKYRAAKQQEWEACVQAGNTHMFELEQWFQQI